MPETAARNRRRLRLPTTPPGSQPDEIRQRIDLFYEERNIDGVRDEAVGLAGQLEASQVQAEMTRRQIEKLAAHQQDLAEKLKAVMAHEHYSVVITGVDLGASPVVEVAGLGGSRVHVAVHPEVDPARLLVGSTGLVTRERNCLLSVVASTGRWKSVGRFEEYVRAPDRILIRERESLFAIDVAHQLRGTALQKGDLIGYDGDVAGLAYERLEPPKSDDLFDENVTDDFSQLGGLDNEIARIKRHIDFRFRFPQLAAKYRLKSKCGILLKGVPGNGKTRIARCCAGYARQLFPNQPCRFMHVSGSSDYTMWFGETEQKIIERFNAVRKAAQDGIVVMFWDEVNAIARNRGSDLGSGAPDRVLNTFLSQLDGVVPLSNVIILYATNRPDTLDPGFLRPGRTDEKIEIPTPNRRGTEAILHRYLREGPPLDTPADGPDAMIGNLLSPLFSPNGSYNEVAEVKLSDGRRMPVAGRELLSGAMLENVVGVAAQNAAVRDAETSQEGVTCDDLAQALEAELMSAASLLAPANVKSYVKSIPQDAQPIAVNALLNFSTQTFVR